MAEPILHEFDYSYREARQHSVVSETTLVVMPQNNTVTRGKDIVFDIPGTDQFIALHKTKLKLRCKITKKNGEACDHAHADRPDVVTAVNNVFHSLFSSATLHMNGHMAELSDNYPYKAYLGTLLTYDKEVMDVRGRMIGWSKDTQGQMDVASSAGANNGAKERGKWFANSKEVTMIGRLHLDFFAQGRSIPPQTKLKIALKPAPDNQVLMAPAGSEYEMHIVAAELLVCVQQAPLSLVEAANKLASKGNLKLNYRRVEVTTENSQGSKKENITLFKNAPLPDRFLVGIVTNKAYAGQYEFNPFNFLHCDINSMQVIVDSTNYPSLAYTPEFENDDGHLQLYDSLLCEFNADSENHMINITPKEFANGYTFFPFRLVPRACCGEVLGEPIKGNVTLKILRKDKSTETLTVIILSEHRSEYEIGKIGGVSTEPKPQQ